MKRNLFGRRRPRARAAALRLATALALALAGPPSWAQEETGNVFGTVADNQGSPLPGVTVTVRGIGAPKVVQTDAAGNFRVLALDPGFYQLTAELEGFSTVEYPSVNVRVARSTTLEVTLSPAVEEVITVTSESPLLDERKIQQGATITEVELEKIPTARDPWSVLTQTAGVISDRINVGGNESGQQAVFRGPGVSDAENSFLVDGVEITDMAAIGSSPTYYDFDQFSEMQFATGGSDVTKSGAGVSVNVVTRRGTNELRGAARYMLTDEDLGAWLQQAEPDIEDEFAAGQTRLPGNTIRRVEDFGFNAGGPVVKDRLWFWGSWGQNDIKQNAANGLADDTILENAAFKANAQVTQKNSGQFSWNNGDKQKFGRTAFSAPEQALETLWDQRGPTAVIKAEDTHIFSSSFYLTGQWSKVDGGFALRSKAGGFAPDLPETLLDSDGVWKNGMVSGRSSRPAEEWKLDGSYFFNAGKSNHELKFGGRFRDFESASPFGWPGRNLVHIAGENFGVEPGPVDFFFLYRAGENPQKLEYTSFWAQDTVTLGNVTLNAGLRYDLQQGENLPASVPNFSGCDPATVGCLPGIDFGGNDAGFEWESISPRIGVTYALGEEKKTLLRASLSRFPEQLATVNISQVNPLGAAYSYFLFVDQNDNNMWDGEAIDGAPVWLSAKGFDPLDPSSTVSPNRTDAGLDAPVTDEALIGVEHALLPEFVVGLTYTYRLTSDVIDYPSLVRDAAGTVRLATRDDYVLDGFATGTLPDGTPFSEPTYALRPELSFTGGSLQRNGDREVEYQGVSLNFTKRLANRWMLRGYLNWEDSEWSVPASFLVTDDPNRTGTLTDEPSTNLGSDLDGGVYAVQSGGSGGKADVWLQSGWSANVNGMYQVAPDQPWSFNVAANLFAREGYPRPYFVALTQSDGVARNILVTDELDTFRTDDIFTVDFRLDKDFAASENVTFTVSMDVFNALNETYVMQREGNLTSSRADFLDESLSPRIWRLGVRLNWR